MTGGGSGRSAGAAAILGDSTFGVSAFGVSRCFGSWCFLGRVGNAGHLGRARRTLAIGAQALDRGTRQIVGIAALFRRRCRHRGSLDRGCRIRRGRDRRRGDAAGWIGDGSTTLIFSFSRGAAVSVDFASCLASALASQP